VLLAAALAAPAAAQVIYVDSSIATPGNGSSWSTAYKDLQAALNAATPGTTVWVGAGGYLGNFQVPAGVTVLAMFFGDGTSPSGVGHNSLLQRSYQNQTILWATSGGTVVTMGAGSVLDGFKIQGGVAGAPGGGGVLVDGVACKIRNCRFENNRDSAGSGAALLVRNGANPRVENSIFYNNGDAASGAAIEIDNASGTFINLTIDSNYHSGIRLRGNATPKIYNCIFSSNGVIPNTTSFGIDQQSTAANPTVENNLFWNNNTALYRHGTTSIGTIGGVNALAFANANISGDPRFVGATDWHLQPTSPCIDAGHTAQHAERNQGFYDSPRRIDGNLDGVARTDIGAAEFNNLHMHIPVDVHRHIHMGVTGTNGLPVLVAGSLSEWPAGLFVNPIGHVYIGVLSSILIAPYGSIPTTGNMAINYPPGVPPGLNTYWQAITAGGAGINVSNPSVHVTN
jgi:parallel beta-helix repeat protein